MKSGNDSLREEWRPVVDYEGFYLISNFGRLKSVARVDCGGEHRKSKIKKQYIDRYGYPCSAFSKDRHEATKTIHRAVAKSFLPNIGNKPQVNHINGIKTDNRLQNLEWCNNSENMRHAFKIGLHKSIGENHRDASLTNVQVIEIFKSKGTCVSIGKRFGINKLIVSRIKTGYTWGSVTGKEYKRKRVI